MSAKEVFQTPKAIAMYPFVTKPNTKFDAEGQYKITLVLDLKNNEEHRQFLRTCKGYVEETANLLKKKIEKMPWRKHLRREDKSDTGMYEVTFKSGYAPRVFDAAGNKINGDLNVGNGSVVKVAYAWAPYEGFGGGVVLYFQALQILELVEYAGGEASDYGFTPTDGFNVEQRFEQATSPQPEDDFAAPKAGVVYGPEQQAPPDDDSPIPF
jgi:hypothetical protein